MHAINFSNFRCFYHEQNVPLAPLTLLVGENSTGKSSFLALIRIMWNLVERHKLISFNDPIFPLGAFNEIISKSTNKGKQRQTFDAELHIKTDSRYFSSRYIKLKAEFKEFASAPRPIKFQIHEEKDNLKICFKLIENNTINIAITTQFNKYLFDYPSVDASDLIRESYSCLQDIRFSLARGLMSRRRSGELKTNEISAHDRKSIINLIQVLDIGPTTNYLNAIAPIRSRPQRTYELAGMNRDHEGGYIPEHLAEIRRREAEDWRTLKQKLEKFGRASGLFDQIIVEFFKKDNRGPFEIRFQKSGKTNGEEPSNIIDMGYGISQALPILTEILEGGSNRLFLMQQPEVHLHPRAQAELGSLFCQVAGNNKMLVVETHSDYLMDRIRIDIREGVSNLTHDMVSILFFKRNSSGVEIVPLRLDENGNLMDAPDEYGDFFMEEKRKVLNL